MYSFGENCRRSGNHISNKIFKLHDSESRFSSGHSYCISYEITVLDILKKGNYKCQSRLFKFNAIYNLLHITYCIYDPVTLHRSMFLGFHLSVLNQGWCVLRGFRAKPL